MNKFNSVRHLGVKNRNTRYGYSATKTLEAGRYARIMRMPRKWVRIVVRAHAAQISCTLTAAFAAE